MFISMLKFAFLALLMHVAASRYIRVYNRYGNTIWLQSLGNRGHPPLQNGEIIKVDADASHTYEITDGEWAGLIWPKIRCQNNGQNCDFGQSKEPCPAGGCHPPADTKVEFYFPPNGDAKDSFYDISLVDGYSLSAEIIPYQNVRLFII